MSFRTGFLVYDSRSGSTLLAKLLTQYFPNVYVTPEIGFDSLLSMGDERVSTSSHASIENALYAKGHYLQNLPMSRPEVRALLQLRAPHGWNISELITQLLQKAFVERQNAELGWIIIKNGSHIRRWDQIVNTFGADAAFICMVRDPRAVYNSKAGTPRPYYPHETMAWGGSLLAAMRWRRYAKELFAMQANNARVHLVKYEKLLAGPEKAMQAIGDFLGGGAPRGLPADRAYLVPDTEKTIHGLVHGEGIEISRIDAWKAGLSPGEIAVIESVTIPGMGKLGYLPIKVRTIFGRYRVISKELPGALWRLCIHTLNHLIR